ncbi:MAG: hypothetical protein KA054_02420 [Candidatus Moranbacteria bacterium]|nr:hypothetical protein [Candidatus Moranbacteria bacterium]
MWRIFIVAFMIFLLSRIGATKQDDMTPPPPEAPKPTVQQSELKSPILYSKGGTLLAFVSEGGSEALADKLKEDQWIRDARNDDACYRFILMFDAKEGKYSLFGGPMRDQLLVYSSDPEEILEWLHDLENLKCNRVRA